MIKANNDKFLKSLSKQLNTDDNVGTAYPIIHKILDYKIEIRPIGYGDGNVIIDRDNDGYLIYTLEEMNERLADSDEDPIEIESYNPAYGCTLEQYYLDFKFDEEFERRYSLIGYEMVGVLKGEFLTRKAAKNHLESNRHHYHKDAKIYVDHIWRNYELEKLLDLIRNNKLKAGD